MSLAFRRAQQKDLFSYKKYVVYYVMSFIIFNKDLIIY